MPLFVIACLAYLLALLIIHAISPKLAPAQTRLALCKNRMMRRSRVLRARPHSQDSQHRRAGIARPFRITICEVSMKSLLHFFLARATFGAAAHCRSRSSHLPRRACASACPRPSFPTHYTLKLTPDLKAATFSGEESIDVNIKQPTQRDHAERHRDQLCSR